MKTFKEWMLQDDGSTDNGATAYVAYISAFEKVHGNIDEYFERIIKDAIDKDMIEENFPNVKPKTVSDYKSGVKRYWKYIKANKEI